MPCHDMSSQHLSMDNSTPSVTPSTPRPACCECRAHKVRCDRVGFHCGPCQRLELACSYSSSRASASATPGQAHSTTQAGLARRRVRRACDTCRVLKARYSGQQPCSRCRARSLTCVFPAGTGTDTGTLDLDLDLDQDLEDTTTQDASLTVLPSSSPPRPVIDVGDGSHSTPTGEIGEESRLHLPPPSHLETRGDTISKLLASPERV